MKRYITREQLEIDPYKSCSFLLWLGISYEVIDGFYQRHVTSFDLERINIPHLLYWFEKEKYTLKISTKKTYIKTGNLEFSEVILIKNAFYNIESETDLFDALWESYLKVSK